MFYQDHEGMYTTSAALTPHALAALAALPPTLVETPARRIVGQELAALLDLAFSCSVRAPIQRGNPTSHPPAMSAIPFARL